MRVLLVNQSNDMASLFQQRGLEVRSVTDGMKALEVAHVFDPDAVVLDDDAVALRLKMLVADQPPLVLALGVPQPRLGIDFFAADAEELVRLLELFG
jgi:hypothetical protein